jgi:hypothetical protein
MLLPFLAAAGEFKDAIKQIDGFRQYLYHPKGQLYSHIWDDENKKFRREAANDRVDVLGYVHDVCGLPNFDRSYFAPEGQAFYLLMETAAKDLG